MEGGKEESAKAECWEARDGAESPGTWWDGLRSLHPALPQPSLGFMEPGHLCGLYATLVGGEQ